MSTSADPILAAILEEAALIPDDEVDLFANPAFQALVDRSLAPYEAALTPKVQEQTRREAALLLATHPDIDVAVARVRVKQGSSLRHESSGVRTQETPAALREIAERQRLGWPSSECHGACIARPGGGHRYEAPQARVSVPRTPAHMR